LGIIGQIIGPPGIACLEPVSSAMKIATTALFTLLSLSLWADPGPFEKTRQVKAAEVLPASVVQGANSQVLDPVENDGYQYTFHLKSKWGEMKVVSTATLSERVSEFEAMAQMEKLKASDEFAKAVANKAQKVVQGGVNLVTDPVGTTKRAFAGIGRMFSNIGNAFSGDEDGGDDIVSEASGFSKVKRSYARQFKVDPYSRNPYLQDTLKDISRAGFLGGAVTSMGLGSIGGAAGMAVNLASTTENLNQMVTQKTPEEVSTYNSETLKRMGVDDDLIDLFLRNQYFTPTERTAMVMALDEMSTVKNRPNVIKFAVLTDHDELASFRRRQVDMYAAYHQKIQPIQEFRFLDPFNAAVLEDGSVLLMFPLDHLLWTEPIAGYVESIQKKLDSPAPPHKYMWFAGTASPLALQHLKAAGWTVEQKAPRRLNPPPSKTP